MYIDFVCSFLPEASNQSTIKCLHTYFQEMVLLPQTWSPPGRCPEDPRRRGRELVVSIKGCIIAFPFTTIHDFKAFGLEFLSFSSTSAVSPPLNDLFTD